MMFPLKLCGCLLDAPVDQLPRYLCHPLVSLVEWRLDVFLQNSSREVLSSAFQHLRHDGRHPVLATNRPTREGGAFDGSEALRMEILDQAAGAGADWVDAEEDTPRDALDVFRSHNTRILLSHHDFSSTPDQTSLMKTAERMARKNPDAIKIATLARSGEDNLRVLQLIAFAGRELGLPAIAFCMGPLGRWSRIASLLLGSPWTYVQLPDQPPAAPGQFTAEQMRAVLELIA